MAAVVGEVAGASGRGIPRRVGRFEVERVLGRGSQGVVYQARDPELGRSVAIKTLRPSRDREALRREARTAGGLSHPGIVPVYEAGEHEGTPYVVYELVDGETLRDCLRRTPVVPSEQVVVWAGQLLDALDHAHGRGVVHRDLNPANIRIDARGSARIMDFGISAAVGETAGTAVVGTASYLAPEQVSGATLGPASDLFSLGLVLWEMLAGEPAIEAPDAMSAMYRIAHEPIDPPSSRGAEVDRRLEALVMRALEKAPEDRFTGARAMRAALDALVPAADAGSGQSNEATIAFLMRRMRRHSDFPAIAAHVTEVRQRTQSESASVEDVSDVILKDMALATKLLRLVNSSLYGQYGGRISTISRAVVILGFEQVRMAALGLMLFDQLGNRPQAAALRDTASRAFISGVIGRRLAAQGRLCDPEEAFVASMLSRFGEHLVAFYLPEELADIHQLVAAGTDTTAACARVLGVQYHELGVAVAKEWKLPETVVSAMRPLADAPVEKASGRAELFQQIAALSNALCDTMSTAEEGVDRDEAIAAVTRRFSDALPIAPRQVMDALAQAVESMKEYSAAVGADLSRTPSVRRAQRFLARTDGAPGEQPAPATAIAAAEPGEAAVADRREALMNGIQDVTNALLERRKLNEVLVLILENMHRGFAFTRVLLCIRDRGRPTMAARFGLGEGAQGLLKRFAFDLSKRADPFARAVLERNDLLWPPSEGTPPPLASWYRELVGARSCLVLPLVVNGVCVGAVYADSVDRANPVDTDLMQYLHTLRGQAALAIGQRAH